MSKTPSLVSAAQVASLWLDDASSCLGFARSRSKSATAVLTMALGMLFSRLRRLCTLGPARYACLMAVERKCHGVGLHLPREDRGQVAPWHLPARWLDASPDQVPRTPLLRNAELMVKDPNAGRPARTAAELIDRLCEQPVGLEGVKENTGARVAVCLHLFYPDLWAGIWSHLQKIDEPWDLFISVPSFSTSDAWAQVRQDKPGALFLRTPNQGRDVQPWLYWLESGLLDGYTAVCKIHGKRSPHLASGDAWRAKLLDELLGSTGNISGIVAAFREQDDLALLGPASQERSILGDPSWRHNRDNLMWLLDRLGLPSSCLQGVFFAGTMFWFRPSFFRAIACAGHRDWPFPAEMGQAEGTLAHAIERIVAPVCAAHRGRIASHSVQS